MPFLSTTLELWAEATPSREGNAYFTAEDTRAAQWGGWLVGGREQCLSAGPDKPLEVHRWKIVAAIPVYNEETTIGEVVRGSQEHVDEVVVIDDGSVDRSEEVALQAGAAVIRHDVNRGYGAAIRSCFKYARNNGTRLLVILDGDGQHRPDQIPRLIAPVEAGLADVSIGSRFLQASSNGSMPLYRHLGIGLLTTLTNLHLHHNRSIRDAQSGFRAYSRSAIEAIDPREEDMGASIEILWDADRSRLRIVEVPVHAERPPRPHSRHPLDHGLSVLASMIRYLGRA